ncbi:MAG: SUMF1/EgtB/PvdO family nonheme iron enzyme [Candidatus Hadarchaeum sp.]
MSMFWFACRLQPVDGAQKLGQEVAGRWAVLIGINDYEHLKPSLNHCVDDIEALAQQLVAGGFERERIALLSTKPSHPRYYPSKANIERELRLTLQSLGPNDFILVAFAGHGIRLEGRSYLCPADAQLEASSLIEVDTVYKLLEEASARFKLFIVDACQNEGRQPKADVQTRFAFKAGAFSLLSQNVPPGILLLASCSPGQEALEDPELGHGVFSHYLIQGLRGEADSSRDGAISLMEWIAYAADRTRVHARKLSRVQSPMVVGSFPDFELIEVKEARNSVGMALVYVPQGMFQMGSGLNDDLAEVDEQPVHKVQISRGFFMSRCEVTVGQFRQFVEETNYKTDVERSPVGGWGYNEVLKRLDRGPQFTWRNPGFRQTDDHPVVNVSWNDAMAFCQWLSRKEAARYRLPTEAEWEYACRAGTSTRYFSGDEPRTLSRVANVANQAVLGSLLVFVSSDNQDSYTFTAPVGSLQPNSFGLHDMHGNVAEWCADRYDPRYYRASSAIDPPGAGSGPSRVVRGGSWRDDPSSCRSSSRDLYLPDSGNCMIGFRVLKESD